MSSFDDLKNLDSTEPVRFEKLKDMFVSVLELIKKNVSEEEFKEKISFVTNKLHAEFESKLESALGRLGLDACVQFLCEIKVGNPEKLKAKRSKIIKWLTDFYVREAKKHIAAPTRGGKAPKFEVTEEMCSWMAENYAGILNIWRKAQKIYRANRNSEQWLEHIKMEIPDLPDDLLTRLCSSDADERKPSNIAIEYTARNSGIPDNTYDWRTLRRFRKAGDQFVVNKSDG